MGPENNVGLGGCWITECLLPCLCMVTVPHVMVRLERMLDYRGVRLERFHCICIKNYLLILVSRSMELHVCVHWLYVHTCICVHACVHTYIIMHVCTHDTYIILL